MLDLAELERITEQEGEAWGLPHVQRILRLAEQIGEGLAYDRHAFAVAAWVHDWGAFPRWRLPGVDHALRSRQVAESEVLPNMALAAAAADAVLEAVERHDYRDQRPVTHPEALLLREADWLDMLGVIGAARELAWGPNNLPQIMARIRHRRAAIPPRLSLAAAQKIAQERSVEMDRLLAQLEAESFGCL